MTDEIRKLLGGYATNTLTETERRILFEAALDDQELFDALQKEQALRDLLDDPVSRVQIRQALDRPAPAPWWSRWWTWTAAASAVAAVVLIVAVTRTPAPIQQYAAAPSSLPVPAPAPQKQENDAELRRPESATAQARVTPFSAHSVSKQAVRARPSLAESARKDEIQPAPAAPPPPPPVAIAAPQQQVQLDAQSPTINGVPSQSRNSETQAQNQQVVAGAISPSNTSQFNPAFSTSGLTLTPVRYTLTRCESV
jgi:hypothetical protein